LTFNAEGSEENVGSNICMLCHQGLESTVSVDQAIGESGPDEVPLDAEGNPSLRFRNPHYFAAGASLFGNEAKGMYQYAGLEYSGRFMHVQGLQACSDCHDQHSLTVNVQTCSSCHGGTEVEKYRNSTIDYDGDGDATEGIAGEIETMTERLYDALGAYTAAQGLPALAYSPTVYPYFFEDKDGNGEVNGEDAGYTRWTPRLLRAAYNYQYVQKDPGAFAHNAPYVIQVLYDSLQDIGSDVTGMTRPEVAPLP